MPGPSPGLHRALLGLWTALGLGLLGLSGKPVWLRVDRVGAEFLDPRSGHKLLPLRPRLAPTLLLHLEPRGPSLTLFPKHTLKTQLPDFSLAQVSTLPSSRSWLLFCMHPRALETPRLP